MNNENKEKIRVLILYASFGGGHVSAAESIKNYFLENYDVEVESLDSFRYINKFLNKISLNFYKNAAKFFPNIWGSLYNIADQGGQLSSTLNIANKLFARKLNKYIQRFNPHAIISTHPFSSQTCAVLTKKNKINTVLSTVMTDYEIHSQWYSNHKFLDYIFVATDEMKELLLNEGIFERELVTTGIPIKPAFLIEHDKEKTYDEFELDKNKKTILFFCGGEYGFGKKVTFLTLEKLIKEFPNHNIVAISGKNQKAYDRIMKIKEENDIYGNVKVLEFTNKVANLMQISDFMVSKPGGLTTTEAFVSGLPIAVVNPIPGQEIGNTKFILDVNAGVYISNEDEIDGKLEVLKDEENIKVFSKNAKMYSKPYATKNICDAVYNSVLKKFDEN